LQLERVLKLRVVFGGRFSAEGVAHGGRSRADAQPHCAEVAVGCAPFPQPQAVDLVLAVSGDLQHDLRLRVVVQVKAALDVVRGDHLFAQFDQAKLVGALLLRFQAAIADEGDQRHRGRGDHRQAHRDQQQHTAPLPAGADDHVADDGNQRQRHLDQLLATAGLAGRRLRDGHFAVGEFGLDAGRAVGELRHESGLR